jgi:hypothetical protein
MDPSLEHPARWPDFQGTFTPAIKATLTTVVPDRYAARVDRNGWIHEPRAEACRLPGRPARR